jgi:methionyl-tRNA formyltransferase
MRIIFMGTPEFAVASLDILVQNNYNIVAVITTPDKPAGRGLQLQESAVKKYALSKGLTILQPEKLKDENFIQTLKSLNADLQIVVAFRMLPEVVWNMPPKGTFNLHASLLPQYRGAAPINWAIINGERETGVTTFFLQQQIDTGNIIYQEKILINDNDTAGIIHDKLMECGASLVLKTVEAIENNTAPSVPQAVYIKEELKEAPKIFKETCKINFEHNCKSIHNLIRGLSPYPTAYFNLSNTEEGKILPVKVYEAQPVKEAHQYLSGTIISDGKSFLKVACGEGFVSIVDLQLAGKKRMLISDFLRGFKLSSHHRAM